MMHTLWRRLVKFLNRRIRRARGRIPVVADSVIARGRRVKGDLHTVFENDRSAGGWDGDDAIRTRCVKIDEQISVRIAYLPALIPAPHSCMARPIGIALSVDIEHIGWNRTDERDDPVGLVDAFDLRHHTGRQRVHSRLSRELKPIVGDLNPVADANTVAAHQDKPSEETDDEIL